MEILIIIGAILITLGIIGSFMPALPGPVFSYIGLVLLYFAKPGVITLRWLIIFGLTMVLITAVDYIAPVLGAKFSGATKTGLIGCIAGSIFGLFFLPPLGIFVGALAGAFVGEILAGKNATQALKAGIGTLLGSFMAILLQIVFSLVVMAYFIIKLF